MIPKDTCLGGMQVFLVEKQRPSVERLTYRETEPPKGAVCSAFPDLGQNRDTESWVTCERENSRYRDGEFPSRLGGHVHGKVENPEELRPWDILGVMRSCSRFGPEISTIDQPTYPRSPPRVIKREYKRGLKRLCLFQH